MALPIRATLDDVNQTCGYLASKPTGATVKEISSVVGEKLADSRRISALQTWGLIEVQEDGKYKVTEDGGDRRREPQNERQFFSRSSGGYQRTRLSSSALHTGEKIR